jgi:hypothetical protein
VLGPACVYGQVSKTRRNDRVVRVERRAVIGAGRLEQALRNSEDSAKLNTSFVERQARWKEYLITSSCFAVITISSGLIGR